MVGGMKKNEEYEMVGAFIQREKIRDHELHRLRAEVARLKAPPTLNIIHHKKGSDPYPYTIQMEFVWQGYHHRTMVSEECWNDAKYKEHVFRYGVEACVRAHTEALMHTLVETEETFEQHYRRMRGQGKPVVTGRE